MPGSINADSGSKHRLVTNLDQSTIENTAIEVGIKSLADFDVAAVVDLQRCQPQPKAELHSVGHTVKGASMKESAPTEPRISFSISDRAFIKYPKSALGSS